MKKLTTGQITVLALATLPMIAVGIGGAIGTYANAASVLHRKETALGVVAAGEGATLVAALVMIGVTMLGQPAPLAIRAALWLLPAAASVMGFAIAPTGTEAVVFALTPLAMTAAAEGVSFLARRIVVHATGTDIEAQRRNAAVLRRIAYHRARAERHPWKWVQKVSELVAWRLMGRLGHGDATLGSALTDVQNIRITDGANVALAAMLSSGPELPAARRHEICAGPTGLLFLRRPVPLRLSTPPPSEPAGPVGDPIDAAEILGRQHAPVVYFITNGSRVKIGTTVNLRKRVSTLCLRVDDIALVLHGGQDFERSLHERFAEHRAGDTEWFELAGDLAAFVAAGGADAAPVPVADPAPTGGAPVASEAPAPVDSANSSERQNEPATGASDNAKIVDSPAPAPRQRAPRTGASRKRNGRRSMTEWVDVAGPVFHAEFERLRRQPTGDEFADAIKKARLGTVSASTAKNIRAEILDRAELPALD